MGFSYLRKCEKWVIFESLRLSPECAYGPSIAGGPRTRSNGEKCRADFRYRPYSLIYRSKQISPQTAQVPKSPKWRFRQKNMDFFKAQNFDPNASGSQSMHCGSSIRPKTRSQIAFLRLEIGFWCFGNFPTIFPKSDFREIWRIFATMSLLRIPKASLRVRVWTQHCRGTENSIKWRKMSGGFLISYLLADISSQSDFNLDIPGITPPKWAISL